MGISVVSSFSYASIWATSEQIFPHFSINSLHYTILLSLLHDTINIFLGKCESPHSVSVQTVNALVVIMPDKCNCHGRLSTFVLSVCFLCAQFYSLLLEYTHCRVLWLWIFWFQTNVKDHGYSSTLRDAMLVFMKEMLFWSWAAQRRGHVHKVSTGKLGTSSSLEKRQGHYSLTYQTL